MAEHAAQPLSLTDMIDKTAGWDVALFQICDYPLIETYDDAALAALRDHAADRGVAARARHPRRATRAP